jgi:uncharacterized protein DUF5679
VDLCYNRLKININNLNLMQHYCLKCKEKREMLDAEMIEMKNGRPAAKGKCGTCGCGMFKIMKKGETLEEAENAEETPDMDKAA